MSDDEKDEVPVAAVPTDRVPDDFPGTDIEWLSRLATSATRVQLSEDAPLVLNLVISAAADRR